MKTALICTPTETIRSGLQSNLTTADYVVDHALNHSEIYEILKYERRTVLISEARKDQFADFLRLSINRSPGITVFMMSGSQIFCLYPYRRVSSHLLSALTRAGITFPEQLLRFINPGSAVPLTVSLID